MKFAKFGGLMTLAYFLLKRTDGGAAIVQISETYLMKNLLFGTALVAVTFVGALHASAATVKFSYDSTGHNYTWEQSSAPTPISFNTASTIIPVSNVIFNGSPISISSVLFFTNFGGGGFTINNFDVVPFGIQIFTGTPGAPVFTNLVANMYNDSAFTELAGVLTARVPEPASMALLGAGLLGLGLARRRRA